MEKCYGSTKLAYAVTDRRRTIPGRIRVFVFHDNSAVRSTLKRSRPSQLLRRRKAFRGSSIAAERWLAHVMDDYRSHFEADLVEFEFIEHNAPDDPY
jgi:hypothetical protein